MNEMARSKVQQILAALYRRELSAEQAEAEIARFISRESLAEFVVDAFNRGWITIGNLGINEDGHPI